MTPADADHLLDTNVVSAIVFPTNPLHDAMRERLERLGGVRVYLPVVAIAEIRSGMAMARSPSPKGVALLGEFLANYPLQLAFDRHTVEPYAMLRAEVWKVHGTPLKRGYKEKQPEELANRVSGKALGIDERDLLIASIACQYRLVLATQDQNQGMRRIQEAAARLDAAGWPFQLIVDIWP